MSKPVMVLVAVLAILATACAGGAGTPAPSASGASTQPSGGASAAATKRPCCTKVTAAYSNISADDWLSWYAFEKGIFTDNGLTVDLQSINGGAQTSAALLAGSVQIAQFAGAEALSANAAGGDPVRGANPAPGHPSQLHQPMGT